MATIKMHTATFNGFTFTRGSKTRTYAFVVIEGGSLAADRIRYEREAREDWRRNFDYQNDKAHGIFTLAEKYPDQYPQERRDQEQAEAQARIARGEEGLVAPVLERFDQNRRNYQTTPDGDTYYVAMGWTSRRDLADKLAQGRPHAIILPATVA